VNKGITRRRVRAAVVAATVAALGLTGCTSGGASTSSQAVASPGVLSTAYKGTTIDVLMPPWGTFKKDVLAKFTAQTGIKVHMQSLAWDSIHDKVVTASASGQSPADVVELDWTWVSQFGAAGWFQDLKKYLSPQQIKDSIGASAFVSDKQQIGLPYSLDFRGMEVNMTMLKKAGITTPPATWDEVLKDSAALQQSGVAHPVGLPLKILEGTATPWYALVRASDGQILSSKGQPDFAKGDAGTKSLEFIRSLYSKGYVDPGAIGLTDQQVGDNFAAGQSAIVLSTGPGGNAQFTDPTKSTISKDSLLFTHIPGMTGNTGPTVGLEEALSIPKASKKAGAAAMFITWWMKTPQLLTAYQDGDMGLLPTTQEALQSLAKSGKLASADTVLKLVGNIQPIVPGGTPTWYTKFSAAAASTIQSVALGNETASAGIANLAKQTKKFAAQ
jgi:multiple sugar transport system substrate-binding protein